MEQQETSVATPLTTRTAGIRFGLISGVISIAYFLVLNVAGVNMAEGYWNWFGYPLAAVLIFLAHKQFKENSDGFMSYGQGIGISFWMGLISAGLSSVFMYIYIKFIDGSFLDMIKETQINKMQEQGMSDEQIEQGMKFASMFMSPESIFIFGLIGGVITAIIIGLIVSIFTQKRAPEQAF